MQKKMNEKVLSSWLEMTTIINNDKITATLPFNEAMICRYLYLHREQKVIASQLCEWMKMQKSQMNRTLTNMENKNLIVRFRNEADRRQIFVELNDEMLEVYAKQHREILHLIDRISEKVGEEKLLEIIDVFQLVSATAKEILEEKK